MCFLASLMLHICFSKVFKPFVGLILSRNGLHEAMASQLLYLRRAMYQMLNLDGRAFEHTHTEELTVSSYLIAGMTPAPNLLLPQVEAWL